MSMSSGNKDSLISPNLIFIIPFVLLSWLITVKWKKKKRQVQVQLSLFEKSKTKQSKTILISQPS